ncbi:hypothetical protein NOCARDAX2BIS_260007 [Nocardioides sp. AX2bis]|nr:hypothetical protein NOCARDAX2BIS_260007 [Nocardioides sp. AX2bis]
MAKRYVSYEERDEFFELLCSGLSLDAAAAAATLNARPRPTLNMRTPAQELDQLLTTPSAA